MISNAPTAVRAVGSRAIAVMTGLLLCSCCPPPASDLAERKIFPSDPEPHDVFGSACDIWGNYAIVQAGYKGSFGQGDYSPYYIFERKPDGKWVQDQKLPGRSDDPFSQHGDVSLSYDFAAFGARNSGNGQTNGAVFIYQRQAPDWTLVKTLEAPASAKVFGRRVALDGPFLVVSDLGPAPGAWVHVYQRVGFDWQLQQTIVPPLTDNQKKGLVVADVAIEGYRLLVGVGDFEEGAVFAYEYEPAAKTWNLEATLKPPAADDGNLFGGALAISRTSTLSHGEYVALVGASSDDEVAKNAGAAYIFRRTSSGWQAPQKIVPCGGQADDQFGLFGDISIDVALVGSWRDNTSGDDAGAAYRFTRSDSSGKWEEAKVLASDGEAGDNFGTGAALHGPQFIIGAIGDGGPPASNFSPGSAYVLEPFEPFDPNLVLEPWPYIYIYTGCQRTFQDQPLRLSLDAGEKVELAVSVATPPAHGRIEIGTPPSELSFVPEPGYVGMDEFRLAVSDQEGNENQVAIQVLVEQER